MGDLLVSVTPFETKSIRGVELEDDGILRIPPHDELVTGERVDHAWYERLSLQEAMGRYYNTNAYCIPYYTQAHHAPRINKSAMAYVQDLDIWSVKWDVMFLDFDTYFGPDKHENHVPWTPESKAQVIEWYKETVVSGICTWGFYLSKNGFRLVQPLPYTVEIGEDYEKLYRGFMHFLVTTFGFNHKSPRLVKPTKRCELPITLDASSITYNHYSRAPNINRSGKGCERTDFMSFESMVRLPPERCQTPSEIQKEPRVRHKPGTSKPLPTIFKDTVALDEEEKRFFHPVGVALAAGHGASSQEIKELKSVLLEAGYNPEFRIKNNPSGHFTTLAIPAYLLKKGVEKNIIPSVMEYITTVSGHPSPYAKRKDAEETVRKFERDPDSIAGYITLQSTPELLIVINLCLEERERQKLEKENKEQEKITLQEKRDKIAEIIRAPLKIFGLATDCGLGKTTESIRLAIELARESIENQKDKEQTLQLKKEAKEKRWLVKALKRDDALEVELEVDDIYKAKAYERGRKEDEQEFIQAQLRIQVLKLGELEEKLNQNKITEVEYTKYVAEINHQYDLKISKYLSKKEDDIVHSSHTCIVLIFPRNDLAEENYNNVQKAIKESGLTIRVAREFSPASITKPIRALEPCKKPHLLPLVKEGNQSLQRIGCHKCEYKNVCKTQYGVEGDNDPHIIVSNQGYMGSWATSKNATIIVDEPGFPVIEETISPQDWQALSNTKHFFSRYHFMADVVRIAEALRTTYAQAASDVFANHPEVQDAHPPGWIGTAPAIAKAFKDRVDARMVDQYTIDQVAQASRILTLLYELAAPVNGNYLEQLEVRLSRMSVDEFNKKYTKEPTKSPLVRFVGTENTEQEKGFVITRMDRGLEAILSRKHGDTGKTILMGADLPTYKEAFETVIGEEFLINPIPINDDNNEEKWISSVKITANDIRKIERTRMERKVARKTIYDYKEGKVHLKERSVTGILTIIKKWIEERPETNKYGFITFMALAHIMRLAKQSVISNDENTNKDIKLIKNTLGSDILNRIEIYWFGGVRGLNSMEEFDGIITAGDPRTNVGHVERIARFLDVKDDLFKSRLQQMMCEDELEQCQGRIRPLKENMPQAYCLHVGEVSPAGLLWKGTKVTLLNAQDTGGATPTAPKPVKTLPTVKMTQQTAQSVVTIDSTTVEDVTGQILTRLERLVAKCGSIRSAADILQCSQTSVSRWISGERQIPKDVITKLLELNL